MNPNWLLDLVEKLVGTTPGPFATELTKISQLIPSRNKRTQTKAHKLDTTEGSSDEADERYII